MIPPEPQNFGFKFPASGSVPVLLSSMLNHHPFSTNITLFKFRSFLTIKYGFLKLSLWLELLPESYSILMLEEEIPTYLFH